AHAPVQQPLRTSEQPVKERPLARVDRRHMTRQRDRERSQDRREPEDRQPTQERHRRLKFSTFVCAAANCCCNRRFSCSRLVNCVCCCVAVSRSVASCCCNCPRSFCSSSSASFITAARSAPVLTTAFVATSTFVGGCVFSSAMRLMSVENVNRLNSRKSQMTMRMLRFMTAQWVSARLSGCKFRREDFALQLRATISGVPG